MKTSMCLLVTLTPGVSLALAAYKECSMKVTIQKLLIGGTMLALGMMGSVSGQTTGALSTGGGGKSLSLWPLIPWLLGGGLGIFILYRIGKSGQRVRLRGILNLGVLAGIALLVVVYLVSAWAVRTYTRPGHMSVIEAQAMDMSAMKPPVGAVPVAAMAALREPIEATVRYSGSAVSYQDVEVTPRVTGTLVWMPFYPGDRVRAGQVVARLDTSELQSRVNEQAANVTMAEHQHMIAGIQAQQAQYQAAQAQAQVSEAVQNVANAQSNLNAAQQEVSADEDERAGAQADLESAQTGVTNAQAQLAAVQADQTYWQAEIKRSQALAKSGAISQQEFQSDQAQAENAFSKVRQAQAGLQQANAGVRAALSRLRKAEAMIASARAKARGMQAMLLASRSKVAQAQDNARALASAAAAAEHEIPHTEAGVQQAQAQLNTARVVAGYTEIRAEVDGRVTQRLLSPGQLVQPGQTILKVSQERPIRLQANVAESDLPNIHVGDRVRVSMMRDHAHAVYARVTSLFPAADPVARTSI
ncbi:MAG TPA: efflux RND transporter periplasmic adaptor subunit, partial [Chthonomonadaceae bacterium]|nr:efflux RND transporter periplasmic adaptor subunit [Chthonomonadaceae bacterium]